VQWQVGVTPAVDGASTVPSGPTVDTLCNDVAPEIGIAGTPVIDRAAGLLYLVAKTKEIVDGAAHFRFRLHALDLGSGAERLGGPALIADSRYDSAGFTPVSGPSVRGDGAGSVGGVVGFDALRANQRAGLLLDRGVVYVAFGSHCDRGAYHGWLLGYDAATLAPRAVFNSTPNGASGGIWMGGASPAVGADGTLYAVTANGSFDGPAATGGKDDYANTVLALVPDATTTADAPGPNGWGLRIGDSFTPSDQELLTQTDKDLGSSAVLLLPDALGNAAHPHIAVVAGKAGVIYVLDRDHLGGYDPAGDHAIDELAGGVRGQLGGAALLGDRLYFASSGDRLKAFSFADGVLGPTPLWSSFRSFSFPGAVPTISSHHGEGAVIWAIDRTTTSLQAFDVFGNVLYDGSLVDDRLPGGVVRLTVPTVASGRVFVGTLAGMVAYGLGPPPAPTLSAHLAGRGITLRWSAVAGVTTFDVFRATTPAEPTLLQADVGGTEYVDTHTFPGTIYYYTVVAHDVVGSSPPSNRVALRAPHDRATASAGGCAFGGSPTAQASSALLLALVLLLAALRVVPRLTARRGRA
jgi:hypothetical protein